MIKKNTLIDTKYIDTILFDIDHTITYHYQEYKILEEVLEILNIPYKQEYNGALYKAICATAKKRHITYEEIEKQYNNYLPCLIENNIKSSEFRQLVFNQEKKHLKTYPYISEVIKYLSTLYNPYCFTDWFLELAIYKIQISDLDSYIKSIFSNQDSNSKKALKSYRELLLKIKKEPQQVLMVGDSYSDAHASKIGIQTVLVDYHNKKDYESSFEVASSVITSPKDLPKILKL